MVSVEVSRKLDIDRLSPREIIERNLRIEREEIINIDNILSDVSIIDEYHAKRLGESMSQDRGQLTPILVRARLQKDVGDVGGGIVYDVMDGFHRAEGRRMKGEKTVRATVVYACSDAEMVDLRILAASSVRSVQFPRLAAWITQAWRQTEWSKRDITVLQAFGLALKDKESTRAKLTTEELPEVRTWVREKCQLWQRGLSSIHEVLRIVADADPDLVMRVRALSGGRDRKTHVTPGRLKPIVLTFPGEENFYIQNIVMDQIIERRLTANESEWFVNQIASEINSGKKIEDVDLGEIASKMPSSGAARSRKNIDEPDDEDLAAIEDDEEFDEETATKNRKKPRKKKRVLGCGNMTTFEYTPFPNPEDVFENVRQAQVDFEREKPTMDEIASGPEMSIRNLGHVGSTTEITMRGKDFTTTQTPLPEVNPEVLSMRDALKKAHDTLQKNGHINDRWFETAPFITETERVVMIMLFREFLDLDMLAGQLKITRLQVIQLAQSAFRKRYLEEESERAELPVDGKTIRSKKSASVS